MHYIYSATSSDGLNFIMDEGYRFASEEVFDPDVVKVGNTWHMYLGKQGNVAAATSNDGLTFTEIGTALREAAIPGVIYENNNFYMFAVGEASKARGIGIFTSNDGNIFSSINKNFSGNGVNDAADPGVIKLSDGTYLMAYKILTPPVNSGKKNKE